MTKAKQVSKVTAGTPVKVAPAKATPVKAASTKVAPKAAEDEVDNTVVITPFRSLTPQQRDTHGHTPRRNPPVWRTAHALTRACGTRLHTLR